MNTELDQDNPLLRGRGPIPFSEVKAWHVEPAIDYCIENAQAIIDEIINVDGPRDYDNTLGALDDSTTLLEEASSIISHLEGLLDDDELRTAYNQVQPKIAAFYSSIPLNDALWKALKDFASTAEARSLDPVRKRLLDKQVSFFRRQGADLAADEKTRLSEIDVALAKATSRFGQNVTDATDAFELIVTDGTRVSGLPEMARKAAQCDAGWRFTLQAPSYIAVMTYADDADLRRTLYQAANTRASSGEFDNSLLLGEILQLRAQKASLLGYDDVSDLFLEDRMAGSGQVASDFVAELRAKTEESARREHDDLQAFRDELNGPSESLKPWDVAYYAEKLRAKTYAVDDEKLRPYFGVDSVVSGLFELFHRLYGVRIDEADDRPVWHESVKAYRVVEPDGTVCGEFYLDLYPRTGKRGGAWMMPLRTGSPWNGEPHVAAICCNMTPPGKDRPALLKHREVETVFHEFGHLMHHLLSKVEVRGLSGTNVAWDFVELPSQIMENWCWDRESLNLFATHFETGSTIPDDLFHKLNAAKNFRAASQMMRQLSFATIDLQLHRVYGAERDGSPLDYARGIAQDFVSVTLPDDYAMLASFQHLFAGPVAYAAGYYSYKWAEVLDADAFTRFAQGGLFSREVGESFRDTVLAKGNSEDPMKLFVDFMGREPDPNALLARAGLA